MPTALPHRLLRLARIDRAIAYTLLQRVWLLGSNALTMLLIVHSLSAQQQGLYFTFLTLLGLHAVFDLGTAFTVTQWAARTRARPDEDAGPPADVAASPAKASVALLAVAARRLVTVLAAAFLVFALCVGTWLFANDARVARSQWLLPWVLATVFTSLRIPLLTLEGVLEGLGKVREVAQVRLAGLVAGTLGLWAVVASGGRLYGISASAALTVCVPALAYGRRYGPLLRDLAAAGRSQGQAFSWSREVWPFQWKYAATVLASFLVVNLFNPAVYYYQGAAAAGRFGLGMSIAQAVAGFMSVWLNCQVPQIALLTAERRHDELRRLFQQTKQSAAAVALLAGAAAMALVGLLALLDPALGARLPSTATLLVLLAAAVLQQYILTVAVFARAHQREPLLVPSLLLACATPCLLALLVPRHGALGAAAAYLLAVALVSAPFAYVTNHQLSAAVAGGAAPAPRKRSRPVFVRYLRGLLALRYWRGELELIRIMAHPGLAAFMRRRPRVLFKYLHQRYLVIGLDSASRLAILVRHYGRLARVLPAPLLRALLEQGLCVWQSGHGQPAVRITLSFPHHDLEGELMLKLWIDDVWIYYLTVTLADGDIFGSGSGPVLLLSCLQGRAQQLDLIRQATRACANTQPPYLLLAATEGLAAALGAERIVAAGNARQLGKAAGKARFDYDSFWGSAGGLPSPAGFYQFARQLPEKPLQAYRSRHRSREARKRELKRRIAQEVAHSLRTGTATPPARKP